VPALQPKLANRRTSGAHFDLVVLNLEEVVERFRGQVSEETRRNWRSMRIGPSFIKIGEAILYPLEQLDSLGSRKPVVCPPSGLLPSEEAAV
jgi:hypothetical protein